jgi:benzoyl-CoA reductase/2-hydroxyglutaryl-CoA dehydratase subunit BcrC/BadD/HgdB
LATRDHPAALPEGVCAFAHAMAALAESPAQPPLVLTTSCDQMRRAADNALGRGASHVFLFYLPATWQTDTVRRLYHAEVERLGRFLERLGGRRPTADELWALMREYDERRRLLRAVVRGASARQAAEALARFPDWAPTPASVSAAPPVDDGIPLAIVGGPLLPSQWPMLDDIESAGGRVVLFATEPGERSLLPPLARPDEPRHPLSTLTDHYFAHCVDVFRRPNSQLYDWLGARLRERRARGIVLWAYVGCDLWRAEAASLREAFQLPVLTLDAHDVRGGALRDANRLAAFIESLP